MNNDIIKLSESDRNLFYLSNDTTGRDIPILLSKDNLVQFIKDFDYVSSVELVRRFDCKGDRCIGFPENNHVILFYGFNEIASKMIVELINEKKVFFQPASQLSYLADGGLMNLPIAKGKDMKKYKTDHWLPCTIRVQEHYEKALKDLKKKEPKSFNNEIFLFNNEVKNG